MSKYYSLSKIIRKNATYNVIFGERSNGKTYASLIHALKDYAKTGKQLAYVRRWKEDITGRRASQLFAGVCENDEVRKITDEKFSGVHYFAGKWYLCNYDDSGKVIYADTDVIAYAFALSDVEHDKSTSFPNIGTIVFDEFLTNRLYLTDEFVQFMNVVSTIVRRRTDVKIYMLGNTVNKYCPYFEEMGLTNVSQMEQGAIDIYRYGNSSLTVAVEYCASIAENQSEETNKYFAFNNPKLQMITGGAWELSIYPHLPQRYRPKDVVFTYFIEFSDAIYQANVVAVDDLTFTYIHIKTTPLQNTNQDLIYSLDHNPRPNYSRNLLRASSRLHEKVLWYFKTDRVFYQNNSVGDAISNYLKICKRI